MGKTALAICGLICILGANVSWAQINSGAITGLITDKTGATIPRAEVSVVNEETQVAQKSQSDRAGEFSAPYLPGGRYTVVVEKQGFSLEIGPLWHKVASRGPSDGSAKISLNFPEVFL